MTLLAFALMVVAIIGWWLTVRRLERVRSRFRHAVDFYVQEVDWHHERHMKMLGRAYAAEAALARMTKRPRGAGGRFVGSSQRA